MRVSKKSKGPIKTFQFRKLKLKYCNLKDILLSHSSFNYYKTHFKFVSSKEYCNKIFLSFVCFELFLVYSKYLMYRHLYKMKNFLNINSPKNVKIIQFSDHL